MRDQQAGFLSPTFGQIHSGGLPTPPACPSPAPFCSLRQQPGDHAMEYSRRRTRRARVPPLQEDCERGGGAFANTFYSTLFFRFLVSFPFSPSLVICEVLFCSTEELLLAHYCYFSLPSLIESQPLSDEWPIRPSSPPKMSEEQKRRE